ncbi:MAG: STAS domain-containing protein [Streptosporangiaceae bacterium]
MIINHRLHGDRAIVAVSGEVDVFTSPELREYLQNLIEEGNLNLILDLTGVEFLDSCGLGVLVGIFHRLQSRDGSLVFAGASERVGKVFHITQLTKIFELYPTLDQALAAGVPTPS